MGQAAAAAAAVTSPSHGASVSAKYHLQKVKLGEGSFGVVWRAVHKTGGEVVAMKQMNKADLPKRGMKRSDVDREIQMLASMQHDNIIRLHETFEDAESIYLAVEYCDGGDFGDKVLERGDVIGEPELAGWVQQMVSAIAYMHARHVCHRDIKPDNFLVAQGSMLKLADLGLALECPPGRLLVDKCGTPAFMAPEQHHLPRRSKGYSLPVDLWAAGVTMYMVMFGGRHPFMDARDSLDEKSMLSGTLDFRKSGLIFSLGFGSEHMSEEARRICQQLVDVDPNRRISARALLDSPWFRKAKMGAAEASPKRERPERPALGAKDAGPGPGALSPARARKTPGTGGGCGPLRKAHTAPCDEAGPSLADGLRDVVDEAMRKLDSVPGRLEEAAKRISLPDAAEAARAAAGLAAGRCQAGGSPAWEFGVRDGFLPYQVECVAVLEEQYQAFCAGTGPTTGKVVSMGREVVVDFKNMVQQVKGSTGRSRPVRRMAAH